MAVIDLVLGIFKVVTFVYDIVTFPIYGMTSVNWKERTRQNLGNVSFIEPFATYFHERQKSNFEFSQFFWDIYLPNVTIMCHNDELSLTMS